MELGVASNVLLNGIEVGFGAWLASEGPGASAALGFRFRSMALWLGAPQGFAQSATLTVNFIDWNWDWSFDVSSEIGLAVLSTSTLQPLESERDAGLNRRYDFRPMALLGGAFGFSGRASHDVRIGARIEPAMVIYRAEGPGFFTLGEVTIFPSVLLNVHMAVGM